MRILPYQLDQIAQVNATLERHTAPRRFIIWRLTHRILKEFGAIAWSLNHRTPSSIENVKILSSRALSRLPEGVIAVVDPGDLTLKQMIKLNPALLEIWFRKDSLGKPQEYLPYMNYRCLAKLYELQGKSFTPEQQKCLTPGQRLAWMLVHPNETLLLPPNLSPTEVQKLWQVLQLTGTSPEAKATFLGQLSHEQLNKLTPTLQSAGDIGDFFDAALKTEPMIDLDTFLPTGWRACSYLKLRTIAPYVNNSVLHMRVSVSRIKVNCSDTERTRLSYTYLEGEARGSWLELYQKQTDPKIIRQMLDKVPTDQLSTIWNNREVIQKGLGKMSETFLIRSSQNRCLNLQPEGPLLQGFSPQLTQPIRNQATWSVDERIVVCIAAHLKDIDIPENLKNELDQPAMQDKLYEYWEKLSFSPVARQALFRYLPQEAKQELANKLKTGEDFQDYFTFADDLATTFPLQWRECFGKEWPQKNELLIPTQLAFSVALRCNEASWIQLMRQLLPNYAGMWLAVVQDPYRLAQATPTFLSCGPTSSPSSAWSLLIKENHPAFSAALTRIPQDKLEEALSHCSFDTPFFESLTEEQWAEIPEDRLHRLLMHWDRKERHAFLHQNPHHQLTQRIYTIFACQCKSNTFAFDAFSDDLDTIKAAILHYASTPRAPRLTEEQITSLISILTLPDAKLEEMLKDLEDFHAENRKNLLAKIRPEAKPNKPPPPPTFDWDAILKDPTTNKTMIDPKIIESGHTFEASTLLQNIQTKACPKTGTPFLLPFKINYALKNRVEKCPLTGQPFDLPYYCVENGLTYSYQAIKHYWEKHKQTPTGEKTCTLIPNRALNTTQKPFPTETITL